MALVATALIHHFWSTLPASNPDMLVLPYRFFSWQLQKTVVIQQSSQLLQAKTVPKTHVKDSVGLLQSFITGCLCRT
jgi:hypothetical protein